MADDAYDSGFEWDERKSEETYARRSIGFDFAIRVFKSDYFEREDTRRDYGEKRYIVVGEVENGIVTVVWTPRGDRRRIISAWPASNRERREYRDYRQTDLGRDGSV